MISLLGRCLALLIRWSGVGWVVRNTVARRRVSIVVYHDPDRDVLAGHLEYVRRRYSVIPLGQLVEALRSGDWNAIPPKSLVITFDDGRAGNFALLDLFRRYRVEPTVFLCTQFVGRGPGLWDVLSQGEIAEMSDSCDFQSHTRSHPTLTACTEREAWEEITESKREVEALVGRRCDHFAYPAGAFSDREAQMAERAGYLSARTVDIGWNHPGTDPYRIRILSIDSRSTTMLAAELSGLKWMARLVSGNGDLRGNRILPSQP